MPTDKTAATTSNATCVEWLPPSNVILPTDVTVEVADLKPGRYSTPEGWLDVS